MAYGALHIEPRYLVARTGFMHRTNLSASLRTAALIAAWAACVPGAFAQQPGPDPAVQLRARYGALTQALERSPIQPGLHVESVESSRAPRGDVYAVIHSPFAAVAAALRSTSRASCAK